MWKFCSDEWFEKPIALMYVYVYVCVARKCGHENSHFFNSLNANGNIKGKKVTIVCVCGLLKSN